MIGARHAAWIEKQHVSAFLVSGDMGVSMQDNINIARGVIRRYMLQAKFQATTDQIDNQRPIAVTVAVSSNDGDFWPDGAQLVKDVLAANVTEVPDFIRALGHVDHVLR